MADQIDLTAATIVTVGPREPYPTGAPPDFTAVPKRVHTPQELTPGPAGAEGSPWEEQRKANMAAGGMIAGGLPWVDPGT